MPKAKGSKGKKRKQLPFPKEKPLPPCHSEAEQEEKERSQESKATGGSDAPMSRPDQHQREMGELRATLEGLTQDLLSLTSGVKAKFAALAVPATRAKPARFLSLTKVGGGDPEGSKEIPPGSTRVKEEPSSEGYEEEVDSPGNTEEEEAFIKRYRAKHPPLDPQGNSLPPSYRVKEEHHSPYPGKAEVSFPHYEVEEGPLVHPKKEEDPYAPSPEDEASLERYLALHLDPEVRAEMAREDARRLEQEQASRAPRERGRYPYCTYPEGEEDPYSTYPDEEEEDPYSTYPDEEEEDPYSTYVQVKSGPPHFREEEETGSEVCPDEEEEEPDLPYYQEEDPMEYEEESASPPRGGYSVEAPSYEEVEMETRSPVVSHSEEEQRGAKAACLPGSGTSAQTPA